MSSLILAITGPAGSGKSTVGEKLAKKLGKCVNIDADHIKHMIVSGFYKDDTSPGGWGFNEWALVGESIGLLAKNFQHNGFDVVINGYIDEPAWTNIEKHLSLTHKFLLLPDLAVVKERDKLRPDDQPMGEEVVTAHHDHFSTSDVYKDYVKINSSDRNIDQTVEDIIARIL
ncbi:MAG: AAA family ATPase [Candidatus Saccharimonadales bacterium]